LTAGTRPRPPLPPPPRAVKKAAGLTTGAASQGAPSRCAFISSWRLLEGGDCRESFRKSSPPSSPNKRLRLGYPLRAFPHVVGPGARFSQIDAGATSWEGQVGPNSRGGLTTLLVDCASKWGPGQVKQAEGPLPRGGPSTGKQSRSQQHGGGVGIEPS